MTSNDLIPQNGWVMELPGLASPHFHKLQGVSTKTGHMTIVDGGTNISYNFSDGIAENGAITLVRTRDGSPDDVAFANFVRDVQKNGKKSAFNVGNGFLKRHFVLVHEFLVNFE